MERLDVPITHSVPFLMVCIDHMHHVRCSFPALRRMLIHSIFYSIMPDLVPSGNTVTRALSFSIAVTVKSRPILLQSPDAPAYIIHALYTTQDGFKINEKK